MADRFTVLLTNPIHPDGAAILSPHARLVVAPDTAAGTLRALAREADGIIVRAKLPDDIAEDAPRLKGIVRHGVGLDFIPMEAVTRRGVAVANLPGSNAQAVAEYCLAALLHMRRRLPLLEGRLREDGWDAARGMAGSLTEIGGTVLGIVGLGTVGRRIARTAHHGFGMTVLGTSRTRASIPEEVEGVALEELFAASDAIVLACPLTEETRGLVDARLIARMKPDALLVNIARGPVVETQALIAALKAGAIGGAVLDVFDSQPLPPESPLLDCPNLLLTPHVAGITATSMRTMSVAAAHEMLLILRGETPRNLVNPSFTSV